MSSERLNELQRQRALAAEQLAWFDREIARESGANPLLAPASAATPTPPAPPPARRPSGDATAAADKIIKRYREDNRPVQDEVRRGCFLYFFTAFAILGLAVLGWYLLRRHA